VGLTANVVQQSSLRISSVAVDSPALILLLHGRKTLSSGTRRWSAEKGDAVVVAAGQTLDTENRLSADGLFEARWVVWDAGLLGQAEASVQRRRELSGVAVLKRVPAGFALAVDRAVEAIGEEAAIPSKIAAHRLTELLLWLCENGITLSAGRATSTNLEVARNDLCHARHALDRRHRSRADRHQRSHPAKKTGRRGDELQCGADRCAHVAGHDLVAVDRTLRRRDRLGRRL
jgi:hypothetical protein